MRMEKIEPLHIERAVLQINFTRAQPARGGSLFSPACKNLRVFPNRGACVVFAFKKGGVRGHASRV